MPAGLARAAAGGWLGHAAAAAAAASSPVVKAAGPARTARAAGKQPAAVACADTDPPLPTPDGGGGGGSGSGSGGASSSSSPRAVLAKGGALFSPPPYTAHDPDPDPAPTQPAARSKWAECAELPRRLRLRGGRATSGVCTQLCLRTTRVCAEQLRQWRRVCGRLWLSYLAGAALGLLFPLLSSQLQAVREVPADAMAGRYFLLQLNASLAQLATLLSLVVFASAMQLGCDTFGADERAAWAREARSGASPLAYYIGRAVALLPLHLAQAYALLLPLYALLEPGCGFGALLAPLLALQLAGGGAGELLALAVGDGAHSAGLVLLLGCGLLAGTYPPLPELAASVEMVSRGSPCRWAVDWLLLVVYSPLGARGSVLGESAAELMGALRYGALCSPDEPFARCAGVREAALGLGAIALLARVLALGALQLRRAE
ncbi:hypothetical protein T492DRAFT_382368 [Pavlovales sp. CCMP2436]|nr:hypothetical protein T492DRAFT_382368 [Pavlovales sp. CCMP2436]